MKPGLSSFTSYPLNHSCFFRAVPLWGLPFRARGKEKEPKEGMEKMRGEKGGREQKKRKGGREVGGEGEHKEKEKGGGRGGRRRERRW